MTEEEISNPAVRLHEAIAAAREYGGGMYSRLTARQVWAEVFAVDLADTMGIFRKLMGLSEAIEWTEVEVNRSEFRRSASYLQCLQNIRSVVHHGGLETVWGEAGKPLTKETVISLLHCADLLVERTGEKNLDLAELKELMEELDSLTESFLSADIDEELRTVILDLLGTSREMLSDYRIRGSASLEKIIELAMGKLATKREKFAQAADQGRLTKLLAWLKRIDDFIARTTKYGPILKGASNLLLGTNTTPDK